MKALLATLSFLFVLFISVSSGIPPAFSDTLTVATLAAMSGGAAPWGIGTDRGVRMKADEINAKGGLKVGKTIYTIKVVSMDHRYVPGDALAAGKMVVREGIKFVFEQGGGVMPALQPVLEENKIINIASMGGGIEFTNGRRPYTFRNMPSGELQYNLLIPKLVKVLGPFKAGVLNSNDELGRSDVKCLGNVIKGQKLPIEEIIEFVERDAIDFSPVLTRFTAKGVNFIFNDLTPAQTATFIKQAWELGYKGRIGIIRAAHNLETLLQVAGKEALEGFISGSLWPPGQYPSAGFETLRSKYLSLYKEEPMITVFQCYSGMEFLAAALEKAGTTDTERVVKVMYDLETETVLGPTSMVGKSLGYGIKTQMSSAIPFSEFRDGRLKLIEVLRYKE